MFFWKLSLSPSLSLYIMIYSQENVVTFLTLLMLYIYYNITPQVIIVPCQVSGQSMVVGLTLTLNSLFLIKKDICMNSLGGITWDWFLVHLQPLYIEILTNRSKIKKTIHLANVQSLVKSLATNKNKTAPFTFTNTQCVHAWVVGSIEWYFPFEVCSEYYCKQTQLQCHLLPRNSQYNLVCCITPKVRWTIWLDSAS